MGQRVAADFSLVDRGKSTCGRASLPGDGFAARVSGAKKQARGQRKWRKSPAKRRYPSVAIASWNARLIIGCVFSALISGLAVAQVNLGPLGPMGVSDTQFELSETVRVDQAGTEVRTLLDQARQYVTDGHWQQAIETYQRVAEQWGKKLVALSPWRYITVRDYCRLQLGRLPPEGLAEYRRRIDPLAERWYREGVAERNSEKLRQVLLRAWASSWTDEALVAGGNRRFPPRSFDSNRPAGSVCRKRTSPWPRYALDWCWCRSWKVH